MNAEILLSSTRIMAVIFRRVCCLFMLSVFVTTKHTTAKYRGIRLSGDVSLNKGFLEISKDGIWGTVCSSDWNMTNKDVACRHLGYPKASPMSIDSERFGFGDKDIWMGDVQCYGDENNLWDCEYTEEPNCEHIEDVNLICQVPGYLGCYGNDPIDWILSGPHFRSTALTIELCLTFCKEEGFELAALGDKADCYCGKEDDVYDRLGEFEETLCGLQCTGSKDETCGGVNKLSVYNVSASFCDDLAKPLGGWVQGDSTLFGHKVTFGCNNGVELIGNNVIQCVLGGTPEKVQWTAQAPYCFGVTAPSITAAKEIGMKDTSGKSIFQENSVIIWSITGVAGVLLILTVLIVTWSVRSVVTRNSRDPEDNSIDFDLEPAGPSGTYRHSIHSLHLLGNIQDNEENNQHEQQSQRNQAIYLREEVKDSVGMQANALTILTRGDEDDIEWDEDMELDSDLEVDPRTSAIEYVGRTAL